MGFCCFKPPTLGSFITAVSRIEYGAPRTYRRNQGRGRKEGSGQRKTAWVARDTALLRAVRGGVAGADVRGRESRVRLEREVQATQGQAGPPRWHVDFSPGGMGSH